MKEVDYLIRIERGSDFSLHVEAKKETFARAIIEAAGEITFEILTGENKGLHGSIELDKPERL